MLRVGLTGGIGSGKTTVSGIFRSLGVPVYDADKAARRLMNSDPQMRKAIISKFGEASYEGSQINRDFLIAHVLQDESKLAMLNSIVHPATLADAIKWMEEQRTPYVLKEAAILFESGSDKLLDYVIGVSAPQPLRLQRVMMRDNRSQQEVEVLMSRQMDEDEKMSRCDFIIHNDGEQPLIPQVVKLHRQLLKMADAG